MADFYVNYGSNNAKLLAYYKVNNVNLKLHRLLDGCFILSKNRRILLESKDPAYSLKAFHNAIYMEDLPDLFNH